MEVMNKKEVEYTDISDVNSLIYAPGCPVIVSKCMIFRNDSDGSLQAVLDFTSISEDMLKEVDISLQGYDHDGNKTRDVIEQKYTDLDMERHDSYGENETIQIPYADICTLKITGIKAYSEDGLLYESGDSVFKALPDRETIHDHFGDEELEKQYRLRTRCNGEYFPTVYEELWFCNCGAVNHSDETSCSLCSFSRDSIDGLDVEELKMQKEERLKAEAEKKKILEEKQRAEKAAKNKKLRTFAVIAGICVIIAIVVAILAVNVFIPKSKYKHATAYYDHEAYAEAVGAYSECIDYKDSRSKVFKAAVKLIEEGDYETASEALDISGNEESGKYRNYIKGMQSFDDSDYEEAKTSFSEAGVLDSEKMMDRCDLMRAEEYYEDGYLNSAQDIFRSLPKDLKYDGVSVKKRLSTLKKYSSFVKMCGVWEHTGKGTYNITQTHISTGSWDGWDGEYEDSGDTVDIKCYIKDNGKVEISGSAEFEIYDEFYYTGAYMQNETKTVSFDETVKSVPNGLYIAEGCQLTFTGDRFDIDYAYTDTSYSINFTLTRTSDFSYGYKKTEY